MFHYDTTGLRGGGGPVRIFFSHSSEMKHVVRALRACLPQHINAWIDDDQLVLGDSIEKTLKSVLASKIDYVLLIIDQHAARSSWVAKEIEWARETERQLGRRILLPVIVERAAWENEAFAALRDRKFVECPATSWSDIRTAAERLSSMLFSLICRDFETLAHGSSGGLDPRHEEHDECAKFAAALREIVFPHRDYNPMPLPALAEELTQREGFDSLGTQSVVDMVAHVLKEGLIPGLVFDGAQIFVREEHYRWKAEMASHAKALIARHAAHQVRSGDIVALDAGSTCEAVAKTLCNLISNRALRDLKIVSNSVPAIELLMDTAVAMGLDEANDLFELHVPAGLARPNTLSISETNADRSGSRGSFAAILRSLGGADIAIVGANGIDPNFGFTTHSARTASSKRQILRGSRKKYIVADSTKFGVHEDIAFATFRDDITLLTDDTPRTAEYQKFFSKGGVFGGPRAKLAIVSEQAAQQHAA